ncbi:MAG: exopolysaccharide biosynthesis protein [Acidobacteriia bacterium]|nr:exopolysaccharide biosynthesis protein [Terriglobia bacterium]
MIDIHSHVLYGLDDGARTFDDSVAMLRVAEENGTTDLVATPHANLEYRYDAALIRQRLGELAARTKIRLYSGCDFHLSYDNIQDAIEHPQKYTINQKCYLLVEFSDLLIFRNTPEIFGRLQDAGMIPVITHPERNGLLRQRIENMQAWIEAGARVQVTGQSFTGRFGSRAREFSETLLDRGLVHFVASDAHDCERRPPKLNEAHAWLAKRCGASVADLLCIENPRAALMGEPVTAPPAAESKKWYQIWR